jgi:hypothetical protein
MPDRVFSAARLRAYSVLEDAGLGDALDLHLRNSVIAGRLWLPFSLIEIAFRNAVDRAVTANHPAGEDWFLAAGRDGDDLIALEVVGIEALRAERDDGTQDDPIAEAARMARRQISRDSVSRDDIIAHLMMGFWVNRCPDALLREFGINLWELVSADCAPRLDDPEELARVMSQLLRMRNRVAHHESLLFRAKHVFTRAGEAKHPHDLVTSLLDAIPAFLRDVELAVTTAETLAPIARKSLASVIDNVRADIGPFEAVLIAERRRLREAREARLAARAARLAARDAEGRA